MKKVLIAVANIPPLLTLAVWPMLVFLSLFAFDDPKATGSILDLLVVAFVWLYPVPVVIGLWRTWKALRAGELSGCLRTTIFAYAGPVLVVGMY